MVGGSGADLLFGWTSWFNWQPTSVSLADLSFLRLFETVEKIVVFSGGKKVGKRLWLLPDSITMQITWDYPPRPDHRRHFPRPGLSSESERTALDVSSEGRGRGRGGASKLNKTREANNVNDRHYFNHPETYIGGCGGGGAAFKMSLQAKLEPKSLENCWN